MPKNYLYSEAEAARAEESIPALTYRELLENLGRLTELGVVAPEYPATMLVAARLVDRARIRQSGVSRAELNAALDQYRSRRDSVHGVVKALERAVALAEIGNARRAGKIAL
jgi:hypothetical protein